MWVREAVFKGRGNPSSDDLFWAAYNWALAHQHTLALADTIVLERQMQARFKIMNNVIRTLYPHKTVLVSPRTISAHFNMPLRRKEKKIATVAYCRLCFDIPIPDDAKQDDMADAALLALYQIEK